MPGTMTAEQILDRQFLEMRCELLNLAASFDRITRAPARGELKNDERLRLLAEGLKIVASDSDNRAEQLQLLLSDEYVEGWNRSF